MGKDGTNVEILFVVIAWKRFGRGLEKVWKRFGRGLEEVWKRFGRGLEEI